MMKDESQSASAVHVRALVTSVVALCCLLLLVGPALCQVATYDPTNGRLRIPSVAVGDHNYSSVELLDRGGLRMALQAAVLQQPKVGSAFATFDAIAGELRIPLVEVGGSFFRDVVLRHLGEYEFDLLSATAGAPLATAVVPPRRMEVITTVDANSVRGTYTIQSLLPDSSPPLQDVASAFVSLVTPSFLRVRGAAFDPNTGHVLDASTRHLVFRGDTGLWRVTLDDGSSAPIAVSSEQRPGRPRLLAQDATGADALLSFTNPASDLRYAWLSDSGATAPRTLPEPLAGRDQQPPFAELDPRSGAVKRLYWFANSGLWSTDRQLGGLTAIPLPANTAVYAIDPGNVTNQRYGFMFRSSDALFRLDFAGGQVRRIFQGPAQQVMKLGQPLVDHEALHVAVETPAGMQLLRCVDAPGTDCTVLAPAATVAASMETLALRQTRDFIIMPLRPDRSALSIRKADGATFKLILPGAAAPPSLDWTAGALSREDQTTFSAGNRVFFSRFDSAMGDVIGSVNGDGSDLREHRGALTAIRALPSAVPPHMITNPSDNHMPVGAMLISQGGSLIDPFATVASLVWLDTISGDLGPVVGTVPVAFVRGTRSFGSTVPYSVMLGARGGTFGRSANVRATPQAMETLRVDSYAVGRSAGSLQRLSNYIP